MFELYATQKLLARPRGGPRAFGIREYPALYISRIKTLFN